MLIYLIVGLLSIALQFRQYLDFATFNDGVSFNQSIWRDKAPYTDAGQGGTHDIHRRLMCTVEYNYHAHRATDDPVLCSILHTKCQ